VSARCLRW